MWPWTWILPCVLSLPLSVHFYNTLSRKVVCWENKSLQCLESMRQLDYTEIAKHSFQRRIHFMSKTLSKNRVWLWALHPATGGTAVLIGFLGKHRPFHFHSHHFLDHLNKYTLFLQQVSWFFLSYFNLSIASIWIFKLDLDISNWIGIVLRHVFTVKHYVWTP